MARHQNSILDDIAEGTATLHWLAGVVLALVIFLLLNWYAGKPLPAAGGAESVVSPALLRSLAFYGQFVIPALLLVISLASFVLNTKRKRLYVKTAGKNSAGSLNGMSRRNFRFLVDEHLRRLHFTIEEPPKDLEGDVDFVAVKGHEKYLVKCRKQTEEVGASEVAGLAKAVAGAGVTGGIVVTAGEYTKEVEKQARTGRVTLIGGRQLHADMSSQELSAATSQRKTGGWMKKILWLVLALLVFLAAGACLYSYKKGVPITTIWTTQIKKVFGGRGEQAGNRQSPGQQTKEKVYRITDDKVKKASEALLRQRVEGGEKKTTPEAPGKARTYYYELELITGGTVFTDNLTVTDTTYTYRNRSGLIVSLRKDQVKSMKKLEVEK